MDFFGTLMRLARKYFKPHHRIIIALLFFTNIAALAFLFNSHNDRAEISKYPLIDFSRNFIAQEHYIINFQPLRDDLKEIIKKEQYKGVEVSIYMEFLNTGANISINPDSRIFPASLNKLPISMAMMKKIENGSWGTNDELVLLPVDINQKYGKLYQYPVGSIFTIEFLLKTALQQSDNTAFAILYRNMDAVELNSVLEELGLKDLFNDAGQITAKEYSRLFRALYTASFLNRENSEFMLEWLSDTDFSEFLSRDIPKNIMFAHKFGINEEDRVFSDSGIVYVENRPYLITVLVSVTGNGTPESDLEHAARIMSEISQKTFLYINEL